MEKIKRTDLNQEIRLDGFITIKDEKFLKEVREYAVRCHQNVNQKYGDKPYTVHIDAVRDNVVRFAKVFNSYQDWINTVGAGSCHDCIEDAQQTYNDVKFKTNKDIADIVLAVTDTPGENRLIKHLNTLPRTIRDYRAIILKMCDNLANVSHGNGEGSSMSKKYQHEYVYKRYIYTEAINWYRDEINMDEFMKLLNELDEAHNYKSND